MAGRSDTRTAAPSRPRRWAPVAALVLATALSGCATTADEGVEYDPFEPANRKFFAFNTALDRNVLKPVADAYVRVTPKPIQDNLYNFFQNVGYPNVVLNDLLQGKILQGVEDASRFVVNSTLGIGGIVDIASGFGIEAHDEDFGQTLAVWGVGEGPYFELPLFGPNSLRHIPDMVVSRLVDPTTYLEPVVTVPMTVTEIVDKRARLDSAIRVRDETALDPYVFQREAYRQRRRHLIHDGNAPLEDLDDVGRIEP